jgi:WD40 repeat protein
MMAKNPKNRYQTPAEVAAALEPFIVATAIAPAPRSRPRARTTDADRTVLLKKPPVLFRKPRRFVIVAAILMFLVAGLVGTAVYRIQTDNGELVIETDNDDVEVVVRDRGKVVKIIDTKSGKHVTLNSGEYELALKDGPEGLKLSPEKVTLKRGETKLATIERVTKPVPEPVGEVRRFEGHTKGAWGVAFSPDGRYALSGAGDGTVRLWEVATGREVRRFSGHNGAVEDVAFSPDGRQALTASHDGTVRLWNVQTGKQIHVLLKQLTQVHRVAFSPDGRRALSGGDDDNTMRLWDLESGRELRRFTGFCGVAFSPDGRRALCGEVSGHIGLWDVETGAGVRQLLGHRRKVTGLVFLPGGHQALSGSHDGTLRLWDLDSGQEIRCFSGHTDIVNRVAITRDGRYALSVSCDKTVRLWDLQTGKELHCFTGDPDGVTGVAVSPDGRYALFGSPDRTIRLWRLPDPPPAEAKTDVPLTPAPQGSLMLFNGKNLDNWEKRGGGQADWKLLPGGVMEVKGGDIVTKDKFAGSFKLHVEFRVPSMPNETGQRRGNSGVYVQGRYEVQILDSFGLPPSKIDCGAIYDFAAPLVNACKAPLIWQSYDIDFTAPVCKDGKKVEPARITVHLNGVLIHDNVPLTTAGTLASLGGDPCTPGPIMLQGLHGPVQFRNIWLVRPEEKVGEVRRFEGHAREVWHVALSADGNLALSVGLDQTGPTARLWKVATGEQLYCFEGLAEDNLGVAFSPDSRTAFCSSGGSVRSWDVATGKERAPLRSEPNCGRIRSLAISDDGRKLLAGGIHAAVLFDVQTGKELQRLDKSGWIHCAALSPDATQILTGADVPTSGGTPLMRLWDAKTGQEIRRFSGHTSRIHDVAFSPDGKRCVSCGSYGDHTLRVFDLASGKELLSIPHPGDLQRGAFLPDGRGFFTTCADGALYLWDVRSGQKLHSFKAHKDGVSAVAVSHDGRYALTGGNPDKTLRLWRLPDPPPAKENP